MFEWEAQVFIKLTNEHCFEGFSFYSNGQTRINTAHSTQPDKYKNTGIGQWIPNTTFKTI
jgi:hypothetical protein